MSVAMKDQGRCVAPRRGYMQLAPVPMSRPASERGGLSYEVVSVRALSQRM